MRTAPIAATRADCTSLDRALAGHSRAAPPVALEPHLTPHHTGSIAHDLQAEPRRSDGIGRQSVTVIGNLQPGCEADFLVLDPQATTLLARKAAAARNMDELLFSLIVLGDDRVVEQVFVNGRPRA